jgi:hypothetical protein
VEREAVFCTANDGLCAVNKRGSSRKAPLVRRLFSAYEAWYASHRHEVPFVLQAAQDRRGIELTLQGVHPALGIFMRPTGLDVTVRWQGECCDLLLSVDLEAKSTGAGWHCEVCEPDGRANFDTLEALWVDHLFNPLADWLRTVLVPGRFLVLECTAECGATWVSVSREEHPPTVGSDGVVLPVHLNG